MNLKEAAKKIAAAPAGLASRQRRTIEPPAAPAETFQSWSAPNPEDTESAGDQRREGARALANSILYKYPYAVSQLPDPDRGGTE
jgi:hypothetical protein